MKRAPGIGGCVTSRRPSAARWRAATLLIVGALLGASSARAQLSVIATSPAAHALDARRGSAIEVEFDRPVDRASVTRDSFWAFGRWSGAAEGALAFRDDDRVMTLMPERPFSAGETVMVILSNALRGADGSSIRSAGYSFQFWTRSRGSGFDFVELERFSTRSSPSVTSRAYGGFGSDLDGDGFLDLTIVNEDTDDLRTFLNRGDRSGRFFDFLEPPAVVGNVPSPSEPSDFDRDGNVDVAVANTQDNTVSILLGNGDGTFGPAQHVVVGTEPRGITVLDADGDGDVDIAATAFLDSGVTLLLNDGSGRFTAGQSLSAGIGERALAAGDMNDDGILDLVVGVLVSQEIHVYLGNGDGSYNFAGRTASGGETWMLVLGDVDGDGDEDVVVVNSSSDNGAVLLGNGRGGLGAARTTVTDPFPLATDLADLDGDGDLDWITSSFFGDWMVFENDGSGSFSLLESFPAPLAASCSIPMDFNGDGALDLVLIDELEDEVVLMASRGVGFSASFESGDTSEWARARGALSVVTPGLAGTGHALEVIVDGTKKSSFVESKYPTKEPSWRVSFEIGVGALDLAGGEVEIMRMSGGRRQAYLMIEDRNGTLEAHLFARENGGFRDVGSVRLPAAGSVRLGVEWASASASSVADGRAALSKDGRVRAEANDLDNHGRVIKKVRLGLPGGSRGATPGTVLFDEYSSRP